MLKLFVYGTLKQNLVNSYLLEGQKYLGQHLLDDYKLVIVSGAKYNFPTLVKEQGSKVSGELYLVSPTVFKLIRQIEAGYSIVEKDGIVFFEMGKELLSKVYKIPLAPTQDKIYTFTKSHEVKLQRVK